MTALLAPSMPAVPGLSLRLLALLLLLSWAPVLLFVDHWPAAAVFQPQGAIAHVHGVQDDGAPPGSIDQGHVDHGHGGAAEGVAGAVLAPPASSTPEMQPPLLAAPHTGEPLRLLRQVVRRQRVS